MPKNQFVGILVPFSRTPSRNNSTGILEQSKKDLIKATNYKNINIDYITKAFMTLSDISLLQGDIQCSEKAIKKALRANKNIKGVKEKLKNINKIKFQSLENYK